MRKTPELINSAEGINMAGRARSFRRGPRRGTDWSASAPQSVVNSIAAGQAAILQTFTPVAGGETLIRTRGMFSVGSDQVAATEDYVGAVGLCVVTEQASTVGISAVPQPSTDATWGGWLWHQYYGNRFTRIDGTGFHPFSMQEYVMDSKAMRKVGEDERLLFVVENVGAVGVVIFEQFRLLTKLH